LERKKKAAKASILRLLQNLQSPASSSCWSCFPPDLRLLLRLRHRLDGRNRWFRQQSAGAALRHSIVRSKKQTRYTHLGQINNAIKHAVA
jgi:hypothetical protein